MRSVPKIVRIRNEFTSKGAWGLGPNKTLRQGLWPHSRARIVTGRTRSRGQAYRPQHFGGRGGATTDPAGPAVGAAALDLDGLDGVGGRADRAGPLGVQGFGGDDHSAQAMRAAVVSGRSGTSGRWAPGPGHTRGQTVMKDPWNGDAMCTPKTTARLVGALFILASATAIIGGSLLLPIEEPDFLSTNAEQTQLATGAVFEVILAASVIAIPALLFPVLRRDSEPLAIGYVAVRTLEAVLVLGATTSALVMTSLVGTGTTTTIGDLLLTTRDWAVRIGTLVVFGAGAGILNTALLRARQVPSWLAWWGLIGGALALLRGVIETYGVELSGLVATVLTAPIGIQEMVFAVWLIVKGLPSAVPPPVVARS